MTRLQVTTSNISRRNTVKVCISDAYCILMINWHNVNKNKPNKQTDNILEKKNLNTFEDGNDMYEGISKRTHIHF